jgi:hypothetical protein
MTDVDDLERIAEIGRRMKLDRVRTYGGGRVEELADMPALVIAERDGREIAVVTADLSEKDAARMCGYYVAACLRPTVVYLVADSRMRYMREGTNERDLRHGELQEDWQAGRRAGITEVMTITRLPKGGPITCRYYPYKRTGKKLRWLETIALDEGARIEGALVDYVTAGFDDDRYRELFEEFGSDPETAGSIDRAACRFLSTQEFICRVRLLRDNDWPADITFVDGTSSADRP